MLWRGASNIIATAAAQVRSPNKLNTTYWKTKVYMTCVMWFQMAGYSKAQFTCGEWIRHLKPLCAKQQERRQSASGVR